MCKCFSTETMGQLIHMEEKLCHAYKRVQTVCIQTIQNCHHGLVNALLVLPGDNILYLHHLCLVSCLSYAE